MRHPDYCISGVTSVWLSVLCSLEPFDLELVFPWHQQQFFRYEGPKPKLGFLCLRFVFQNDINRSISVAEERFNNLSLEERESSMKRLLLM